MTNLSTEDSKKLKQFKRMLEEINALIVITENKAEIRSFCEKQTNCNECILDGKCYFPMIGSIVTYRENHILEAKEIIINEIKKLEPEWKEENTFKKDLIDVLVKHGIQE